MDAKEDIGILLRELPSLAKSRLSELWKQHFGSPPCGSLRSELMRPVLAYRIQEQRYGVVSKPIQNLRQRYASTDGPRRFKAGTRIVREWKGEIHEISVTAMGYEYRGETYKSLSPIANRITGTRWSGPAFFGTKPKDRAK
jgi:Protein of unknown function (DUF2924)